MRTAADAPAEAILVLRTLAAPERRRLRGRRGTRATEAAPEPVPTTRATVVRPQPFADAGEAERWLAEARREADAELAAAVAVVNRALHAHRVAAADPYAADVAPERALVARIGYGGGDAVADGRFDDAWELPRPARERPKRSMEAPEERFAAILGGREAALAAEDLVLRARADLTAGRTREAALTARVALEALIAETGAPLDDQRGPVGEAANAALRGEPDAAALEQALDRMEAALRRRRLTSGA